eukprot:6214663-Pleurochrysis_carterae.AAC.2
MDTPTEVARPVRVFLQTGTSVIHIMLKLAGYEKVIVRSDGCWRRFTPKSAPGVFSTKERIQEAEIAKGKEQQRALKATIRELETERDILAASNFGQVNGVGPLEQAERQAAAEHAAARSSASKPPAALRKPYLNAKQDLPSQSHSKRLKLGLQKATGSVSSLTADVKARDEELAAKETEIAGVRTEVRDLRRELKAATREINRRGRGCVTPERL